MWNFAGLAVAGVVGVVLNLAIGLKYGPSALGVFNQVFALYIVLAQIAALGIHHSVLRAVAVAEDADEKSASCISALMLTLLIGSLTAILLFVLSSPIGRLLRSEDVAVGAALAAPGVLFFALNKVTLGILNGNRQMRAYAVIFAMRLVFMLASFVVCVALGVELNQLAIILTTAEMATLALSLFTCRPLLKRSPPIAVHRWVRRHLDFGVRGFLSGIFAEMNTRVDVVMLGVISSDRVVGIYSFAAILAEAMAQLLVVIRNNYTPICARLYAEDRIDELSEMVRNSIKRVYLVSLPIITISILIYIYVVPLLNNDEVVTESAPVFTILLVGIAATAGYMPFSNLLLAANRPGLHTWLMIGVVAFNVLANGILIVLFDMIGAAIGTAFSFIVAMIGLRLLSRKFLNLAV